jgi:hypothetical protein
MNIHEMAIYFLDRGMNITLADRKFKNTNLI